MAEENIVDPVDPKTSAPAGHSENDKQKFVPLEAHRQLLDEKKKTQQMLAEMQAKIAAFEAESQAKIEADLISQKKFEELAKAKTAEADKAKAALEAFVADQADKSKRSLVMEKIGKFKKSSYEALLDISDVDVSDLQKLEAFCNQFRLDHADVLVPRAATPPPVTAPRSGSNGTTKPKTLDEHARAAAEYAASKLKK